LQLFIAARPLPLVAQSDVEARTVDATTNSTAVVRSGFDLKAKIPGDATGTQNCHQTNQQIYAGSQIGTDIGKLNIGNSGANLHFGVTASFFDAWARDTTPSTNPAMVRDQTPPLP